jgi:hypothetical protein
MIDTKIDVGWLPGARFPEDLSDPSALIDLPSITASNIFPFLSTSYRILIREVFDERKPNQLHRTSCCETPPVHVRLLRQLGSRFIVAPRLPKRMNHTPET